LDDIDESFYELWNYEDGAWNLILPLNTKALLEQKLSFADLIKILCTEWPYGFDEKRLTIIHAENKPFLQCKTSFVENFEDFSDENEDGEEVGAKLKDFFLYVINLHLFSQGYDNCDKIAKREIENSKAKLADIQTLLDEYGRVDGEHHLKWLLGKIALAVVDSVEEYDAHFTRSTRDSWDEGVAP
jgi:hypothetical protein